MSNGKAVPGILHLRHGRTLDILRPTPEDIELEDIVYALSNINRFTGHASPTYSVAQHSLFVASLVDESLRKEALLHDATEAYLGDVASPLKMLPHMRQYRILEDNLRAVIADRFGLEREVPRSVSEADALAGQIEFKALVEKAPDVRIEPFTPYYIAAYDLYSELKELV